MAPPVSTQSVPSYTSVVSVSFKNENMPSTGDAIADPRAADDANTKMPCIK
jgi:hypothetical protein